MGDKPSVGAILLIISACIAGFFLTVAIVSEFGGVYPSWYDYQPWYPDYPGGYEGQPMNLALVLWASFFAVTLPNGLYALLTRNFTIPIIGTIVAIVLLILANIAAPTMSALLWSLPSLIIAGLGASFIGTGIKPRKSPSFKLRARIGVIVAGAFLPLYICVGFSVIHLNGDADWFLRHLGVNFPWILFPLGLVVFTLSVVGIADYWMEDTGHWSRITKNGAIIAGVGLLIFLIGFLIKLIEQLFIWWQGTLFYASEVVNWGLFLGFFTGFVVAFAGNMLFLIGRLFQLKLQ